MSNSGKLSSYIGFSIKAGKAVYGTDNVMKKACKVVLIDKTLSENSMKTLAKYLTDRNTEFFVLDELEQYTHKSGCKVIGLRDASLSDAVKAILKGENGI